MILVAYTDASYCEKTNVAACGFSVYDEWILIKHEITLVAGIGNIQKAEIFAMSAALQFCFLKKGVKKIVLNTDQVLARSKKQRDLRPEYFDLNLIIEVISEGGVTLDINHVRGHHVSTRHNKVDVSCNKALNDFRIEHGEKTQNPYWRNRRPKGWRRDSNRR